MQHAPPFLQDPEHCNCIPPKGGTNQKPVVFPCSFSSWGIGQPTLQPPNAMVVAQQLNEVPGAWLQCYSKERPQIRVQKTGQGPSFPAAGKAATPNLLFFHISSVDLKVQRLKDQQKPWLDHHFTSIDSIASLASKGPALWAQFQFQSRGLTCQQHMVPMLPFIVA